MPSRFLDAGMAGAVDVFGRTTDSYPPDDNSREKMHSLL